MARFAWEPADYKTLLVRPVTFFKTRKKASTGAPLYETIGADLFSFERKVRQLCSRVLSSGS